MVNINEKAPEFTEKAYINGEIKKISLKDYRGKWVVLFFYPADFTFVCPTELGELADHYDEIKNLNAEVISVSTDTAFVHKAWWDNSETIKKINLKVLESLDNSMHKFVRTILINNVYEINESFSDEMGEKSYKITTKQSDKIINVKYNQIYKLKILNEGKKNYLLISSYDNKNILLDEKLNELLNTY